MRVLGSLLVIDLERGEIDSETEAEVDFTHFRSIESLWIILDQFSRKEREDDFAYFRWSILFESLSTIDLKEEEIDSE